MSNRLFKAKGSRNAGSKPATESDKGGVMNLEGGCACGSIRYKLTASPLIVHACHCRDCQKATGGAFVTAVAVPLAAVTITGQPKYHSVEAENGNSMCRGFCPECGSRLFVKNSGRADSIGIHLGSLDDPSRYQPVMDIGLRARRSGTT